MHSSLDIFLLHCRAVYRRTFVCVKRLKITIYKSRGCVYKLLLFFVTRILTVLGTWWFPFQNEARKLNHQEVVEEDRRNKLPENFEAKRRRLEWEEDEEERRKVYLSSGFILIII